MSVACCLWYCKSTIFQANHNEKLQGCIGRRLFVILQKYDFSSKSQPPSWIQLHRNSCLWYCKSTIFQANHNSSSNSLVSSGLFVILQKYDFSSKSQRSCLPSRNCVSCLWYCKSTIFQANYNNHGRGWSMSLVVCDTAKVRFFKQITTGIKRTENEQTLFVILQKYDFSSKSQLMRLKANLTAGCLWYCKSTIFQANHNYPRGCW